MKSIKIGRTEYEIKKGDYILNNGACFQFVAGDGRTLKFKKWSKYNSLILPKSVVKKIDLTQLKFAQHDKFKFYYFQ